MNIVPLQPIPAQTLTVVLNGQECQLRVYTKTGYVYTDIPELVAPNENIYLDLSANGVVITTTAICLQGNRLLRNREYLGFLGDLMFVDTQGDAAPQFAGLGTRWVLLYLSPDDLGA